MLHMLNAHEAAILRETAGRVRAFDIDEKCLAWGQYLWALCWRGKLRRQLRPQFCSDGSEGLQGRLWGHVP